MIERNQATLSVRRQCDLLSLNRSSLYYTPSECSDDIKLVNAISEIWDEIPVYGYRRITAQLRRAGFEVNRKRVARLMKEAGLQAIYQKPKTSVSNDEHKKYPYLLRGLVIGRPHQVWVTDLTYIKMPRGFVYLMGIMDVYSRKILAWDVGITMDLSFCLVILEEALKIGTPEIVNTDQGSQYTALEWIALVESCQAQVSMDGVGRWADNIPIERFWRTVKWEHLFLRDLATPLAVKASMGEFIEFYNNRRLHQTLGYNTPEEVYSGKVLAEPTILGLQKPTLEGGIPPLGCSKTEGWRMQRKSANGEWSLTIFDEILV